MLAPQVINVKYKNCLLENIFFKTGTFFDIVIFASRRVTLLLLAQKKVTSCRATPDMRPFKMNLSGKFNSYSKSI
jgi:hypothetical protein